MSSTPLMSAETYMHEFDEVMNEGVVPVLFRVVPAH